jgi:hypothetical protein
MDPYEWGEAAVSYPDWVGTAQLDQKLTEPVDVYDLTGIDRDEWLIVGLDFGGGESGMHNPHVIAVRKSELYGRHISEIANVRAADIQIHDVDPFELLRQMTHLLDMRFRIRAVEQATITITELLDEPPQLEPEAGVATSDEVFRMADAMAETLRQRDRLQPLAFQRGYNVTFDGSFVTGTGAEPEITYFVWRIDEHPQNHTGKSFSSPTDVEAYLEYLAGLPRYRLDLTGDAQVEEVTDGEQPFTTITDSASGKEFQVRVIDLEATTVLYMHSEDPLGGSWRLDNSRTIG